MQEYSSKFLVYISLSNWRDFYFVKLCFLFLFFFLHPFQIKDRVLDSKRYVYTAQKMKFSIQDFFSKCDQIRRYKAINKGSGVEKKNDFYVTSLSNGPMDKMRKFVVQNRQQHAKLGFWLHEIDRYRSWLC